MTAFRTALLCSAAGAFLAYPAMAQSNVVASDPGSVIAFFESEGFPVTLDSDGQGDPLIEVKYFGNSFSIYFYGCDNNTDCLSIQFFSGYRTEGSVPVEKINEWNTEFRYIRAYLTEEQSSRIEFDVYLGANGLSHEDFDGVVDNWTRGLQRFEEFIDW
ncbi:MAG: YbjN domain-containing protein [Rhodobacteraceae bacterium]|nr:YbjN domain-containing protein [Paracoccaceae bacterium]